MPMINGEIEGMRLVTAHHYTECGRRAFLTLRSLVENHVLLPPLFSDVLFFKKDEGKRATVFTTDCGGGMWYALIVHQFAYDATWGTECVELQTRDGIKRFTWDSELSKWLES